MTVAIAGAIFRTCHQKITRIHLVARYMAYPRFRVLDVSSLASTSSTITHMRLKLLEARDLPLAEETKNVVSCTMQAPIHKSLAISLAETN
jgi:hypothetical protein